MSVIKAITADQSLNIKNLPVISSGGVGTDSLLVAFDKSWTIEGTERFANFFRNTADDGVAVSLNSQTENKYTCTIPAEFLASEGLFHFAVFAKNPSGTIIKTSTACNVKVLPGAFPGAPVQIDWQGFFNQLVGVLNEKFSAELATDADLETVLEFIRRIEDGGALWKWVIRLLRANGYMVTEEMSKDDVDISFTTAHGENMAALSDYGAFVNSMYDTIKNNIDPELEPISDTNYAAMVYIGKLVDYFATHVPKFELDEAESTIIDLSDDNQKAIDYLYEYFGG